MEKEQLYTTFETTDEYSAAAAKTLRVSMAGNAALALMKLLGGMMARSGALISDAAHSAADVFSSILILIGVRAAAKDADNEHPYGHERFECVAAVVLSVILCIVGLFIGRSAIGKLTAGNAGAAEPPGIPALAAAVASILGKEAMYRYTRFHAVRIGSGGLMAEAWHHRTDALSSLGALVGIWGARRGHPWLDAAASLFIGAFIIKAACAVFADAVKKMVDRSCDAETLAQLRGCVAAVSGVTGIDRLTARLFANRLYVDLEMREDGDLPLSEAHRVAEQVHDRVERQFPAVKHIMIHVNPEDANEQ